MTTVGPRLEIAFGVPASEEPGDTDWVDVTEFLRDFDGGPGGRQRNLDRVEAGSMRFTLSNFDRRFDPTYVAGAYHPGVVPNAHLRLVEDSTGRSLFRGHVDGWPNKYPFHGKDAVVEITATDAFKIMADSSLSRTVWEREIHELARAGTASVWLRLGDTPGTTQLRDSSYSPVIVRAVGSPILGEEGLLRSEDTSCRFEPGDYLVVEDPNLANFGNNWSLEVVIRRPSFDSLPLATGNNGGQEPILDVRHKQGSGGVVAPSIISLTMDYGEVSFTGDITAQVIVDGGSGASVGDQPPQPDDDKVHHLLLVREWNGVTGSVKLYFDGVLMDSSAMDNGAVPVEPFDQFVVGNFVGLAGDTETGTQPFRGWLQEVVAYKTTALTAAQAAEHAGWVLHPFAGVRSGQAISDTLDDIGWPASRRNVAPGLSALQDHELGGQMLEYAQRVAETEAGIFGVDGNGDAVFFGRELVQSQEDRVPLLTFANDPVDGLGHIPYDEIEFAHDDTQLINEARVAREGGNEFVYRDSDSIDRFQRHGFEATGLLHDNEDETKDHARWVVQRRKDFRSEVRSLTVNLRDPRLDVGRLLETFEGRSPGLVLVEVVHTLTPNPDYPGGEDPIVGKYRIEQVSYTGQPRPRSLRMTLRLSPWDEDVDVPWILGDATYGVLGSTTRLGF